LKKRDNRKTTAVVIMIIFLSAAALAALSAEWLSWQGNPFDKGALKNGTVRGSILSEVPRETVVEEPEKEPVEEIEPEIEKDIVNEEAEELTGEHQGKEVDLIVFAGQSNMSGHGGDPELAPEVVPGAGAEFRSVSDPTKLYRIAEPFGIYENTEIMNDFYLKRGSLVSSFVNTWYAETGTPVIAVSASKGGMPSTYWASDAVCGEVENRFRSAKLWLEENGYIVKNQFLLFLQGESDVLEQVSDEQYLTDINVFSTRLFNAGIDKFLMIRIGRVKGRTAAFKRIADLQTELCRTDPRFVLVSTILSGIGDDHMTDAYHYDQAALNLLGEDAARNGAFFANNREDPEITDFATGEKYIPVKYEGI